MLLEPGGRAFFPLALGSDHLDDLPSAGDEIGQQLGFRTGQRPRLEPGGLGEVSHEASVDRVGLGALTDGRGEGAHLDRLDHGHRRVCDFASPRPAPHWPSGRARLSSIGPARL